jgi:hypothetical protein
MKYSALNEAAEPSPLFRSRKDAQKVVSDEERDGEVRDVRYLSLHPTA